MKNKYLLTGAAMGIAAAGLYSAPALAAGTTAGSTITNLVTVSYEVSGVDQTDETDTDDITVDRKINLTLARTDDTATTVTPGGTNRAVTFQLTNTSNAELDFDLSAVQPVGGSAAITGTDAFDVGALTFYLDDGDNVYDGGDTLITHLDSLNPDTPVVIHVLGATVPLGLDTADRATVRLTATAREDDSATTLGTTLTEATSNTAAMDTLFADGAGLTDAARDAAYSAGDDFVVLTAALTATKSSTILSNSANFNTGTAVPGATIEYCITVSNASGGADATNLSISDTLPGTVTYVSGFGVKVGGADCNTPGTDNGSESSGTVSGTISTLAAGTSQTLIFRATIN